MRWWSGQRRKTKKNDLGTVAGYKQATPSGVLREPMKAVILAAGKGTRMGELTQEVPKPMLRVQGKPVLQHIVEGIVAAGISDLCLITGYRAEVIENYFSNGSDYGIGISYARQRVQDG